MSFAVTVQNVGTRFPTRLCGFVIGREYLCTNARKGNLLPVGNEETVPGEGAVGAVPFRGSWDVGMWGWTRGGGSRWGGTSAGRGVEVE